MIIDVTLICYQKLLASKRSYNTFGFLKYNNYNIKSRPYNKCFAKKRNVTCLYILQIKSMHSFIKFWSISDSGLFNWNRIIWSFVSLQLRVQCIKFLIVSKAINFPVPSGVHTKEMFKGSNIETKNNTFSMLRFKYFFYAFFVLYVEYIGNI